MPAWSTIQDLHQYLIEHYQRCGTQHRILGVRVVPDAYFNGLAGLFIKAATQSASGYAFDRRSAVPVIEGFDVRAVAGSGYFERGTEVVVSEEGFTYPYFQIMTIPEILPGRSSHLYNMSAGEWPNGIASLACLPSASAYNERGLCSITDFRLYRMLEKLCQTYGLFVSRVTPQAIYITEYKVGCSLLAHLRDFDSPLNSLIYERNWLRERTSATGVRIHGNHALDDLSSNSPTLHRTYRIRIVESVQATLLDVVGLLRDVEFKDVVDRSITPREQERLLEVILASDMELPVRNALYRKFNP